MEFLQKGTEKSRETLKTFGSKKFYGSKSQTPDKGFGSFSNYSSQRKRTPGLMPDPTPTKLPRLSDVKYSWKWSKSKTPPVSNSETQGSLHGFSNLGNTCYMNAILQSLFALKPLTHDLLRSNQQLLPTLSKESLYYNLSKLLCVRKKTNVAESVKQDLLRNVKTAISSTAKRFSGYQQHDAHEFLGQVLDQLKEEVVKINKTTPSKYTGTDSDVTVKTPSKCTAAENDLTRQEFVNPTIENFEFEVTHTIQCTSCGLKVTKAEQFNDLSLDLPRHGNLDESQTIQDALDLFLRDEKLEYTCAECGCKQSQVFHAFTRLPRVLVVHLKRYGYSVSKSENTKLGQTIFIPRFLTLQQFCTKSTQSPSSPFTGESLSVTSAESAMSDDRFHFKRKSLNVRKRNLFSGTPRGSHSSESLEFETDTWTSLEKKPRRSSFLEALDDTEVIVKDQDCEEEGSKQYVDLRGEEEIIENKTQVKSSKDEQTELTEEEQLEKALELSRLEAQQNSTVDMSDLQLENMTEYEMLSLAMERSISESTNQKTSYISFVDDTSTNKNQGKVNLVDDTSTNKNHGKVNLVDDTSTNKNHGKVNLVDDTSTNKNHGKVNQSDSTKENSSEGFNSVPSKKPNKHIGSRLARLSYSASKTSKRCLDLENVSPICRKTYSKTNSKANLKGGAMEPWDSVVGKKRPVIFSDDEVTLVKSDSDLETSDIDNCHVRKSDRKYDAEKSDKKTDLKQSDFKKSDDQKYSIKKSHIEIDDKLQKCDVEKTDFNKSNVETSEEKAVDRKVDVQKSAVFQDDFDEVDGGRLMGIYKSPPAPQFEEDFLMCQEKDKDLENKENQTPPHSTENLITDNVWTTPSHNRGNEEPQDVFAFTLDEEDEEIRKAKELSLQDIESDFHTSGDNPTYLQPSPVIRSKEESKVLKKHFEDGNLPNAYRLVSVVSHIGSTSSAGHYISDVYDSKKESWYSYNDSHITEISEAEVRLRRERSGYIFFYMCRNIYDDI